MADQTIIDLLKRIGAPVPGSVQSMDLTKALPALDLTKEEEQIVALRNALGEDVIPYGSKEKPLAIIDYLTQLKKEVPVKIEQNPTLAGWQKPQPVPVVEPEGIDFFNSTQRAITDEDVKKALLTNFLKPKKPDFSTVGEDIKKQLISKVEIAGKQIWKKLPKGMSKESKNAEIYSQLDSIFGKDVVDAALLFANPKKNIKNETKNNASVVKEASKSTPQTAAPIIKWSIDENGNMVQE